MLCCGLGGAGRGRARRGKPARRCRYTGILPAEHLKGTGKVFLVVGLGNPGRRYRHTRHNLGFMVIDGLHERLGGGRWRRCGQALISRTGPDRGVAWLAKPLTFMNNSGVAVADLVRNLRPEAGSLIIVHDDIDLPVGRLRLRSGGSAGGHRGVASIIDALGTDQVRRVKVGVGRPPEDQDPVDYVLGGVTAREEWEMLSNAVDRAAAAVEFLLDGNSWQEAMNRFNSR